MKQNKFEIGIAILIILVPFVITGPLFNTSNAIGELLVADYAMKTISLIVGLVILYDIVKNRKS